MDPSPAAVERVRLWTRSALLVEGGDAPLALPPSSLGADELVAAVFRHRVVELLDDQAAAIELGKPLADRLHSQRRAAHRTIMVQLLEIGRIGSLFGDAGVDWLSLKGPALAVQTTGVVDGRGGGDIDVLVDPSSVERVYRMLVASGWTVRPPSPHDPASWAWRHVLRTYNEMTFDGPHSTVDVHWRLDPTHSALPGFADAWADRVDVDLPGVTVASLGPRHAFSHTCHHAAKDDWRWLRSLVDVHRLARSPDVWRTTDLSRLEQSTLSVTESCLGLPSAVPAAVLDRARAVPARVAMHARAAQDRAPNLDQQMPGAHMVRAVRYRLAASRAPVDLRILLAATALPADSVADLNAASAWEALPRLALRRLSRLLRKIAVWLNRAPDEKTRLAGRT